MQSTVQPTGTAAVRELIGARELLRNLTVRELKVRYKRSALGFVWTLLNPLLMMAVFTLVFAAFFRSSGLEWFPIYFLSAYLPFAFFQASFSSGVSVMTCVLPDFLTFSSAWSFSFWAMSLL